MSRKTRSKTAVYKNEAILLIGGAGFLGSHIVDGLMREGYTNVTILDLRRPLLKEHQNVAFVQADLTDAESLARAFDQTKPAVVMHTASPPHGRPPAFYDSVNVIGTKSVISLCVRHGVRRLVYTSSCSVVYNGSDIVNGVETLPYAENHMDAYNSTKAQAEVLVLEANSSDLQTVALRPSGIFGYVSTTESAFFLFGSRA